MHCEYGRITEMFQLASHYIINCLCFIYIFSYEKSGNQALVDSLAKWVFQEKGVLRAGKVTHHKVGETSPPEAYTITDDVVCCCFHLMSHPMARLYNVLPFYLLLPLGLKSELHKRYLQHFLPNLYKI